LLCVLLTASAKENTIHVRVRSSTPQTLGRYQIEAEIGRGAMGVVYRARDPKIDRLVAIKTISLAGQDPEEEQAYRERFVQEARAAGRLSHPGIVAIFDAGEDPGTHEPYLVMEYVAGEPLSRILAGGDHKLPLSDALRFAYEVAEALDYAHSQGVIHRDIKPANILITEDGRAKIADFGVARLNHALVTHSGQIFGSPAYMAPEQLNGGVADARSDLFSLGVMLYSMITGFRPFQGNSAETVCFKVMNIEPVPVTSFQHDVPAELDAIMARAIAKVPAERFQSGAAMAQQIQSFVGSGVSGGDVTSFFARVIRKDAATASAKWDRKVQQNEVLGTRLFWGSLMLAVVLAGLFTTWQQTEGIRTAAAIEPPSVPAPAAPPISKTPRSAAVVHRILPAKKPQKLAETQVEMAKVQVEILHHFNAGRASIWLDDQLVFEQSLHGNNQRHSLFQRVEMNQTTSFQFTSGKHLLQVRVVSPASTYDQIETLDADLSAGSEHVLQVNCDKRRMQVTLQ
jgi:predicted Ser/Thr protein kinase